MKQVREGYFMSEKRLATVGKSMYGAEKNVFQWLISLFKGKAKETSESEK